MAPEATAGGCGLASSVSVPSGQWRAWSLPLQSHVPGRTMLRVKLEPQLVLTSVSNEEFGNSPMSWVPQKLGTTWHSWVPVEYGSAPLASGKVDFVMDLGAREVLQQSPRLLHDAADNVRTLLDRFAVEVSLGPCRVVSAFALVSLAQGPESCLCCRAGSAWAMLLRSLTARPLVPLPASHCFQDTECKIRSVLEVVLDSDGVGDVQKIRSTTGVVVTRGSHQLRHSVVLQSSIGLSSAEAKCCALLRGACLDLGVQSYFTDWRPHIEN